VSATVLDPSTTDLLFVVVFQLGLCVVFLAEVANAAHGYDTLLALVGQLLGGLLAVGALLMLVLRYRLGVRR
jgi:hypothetical protein